MHQHIPAWTLWLLVPVMLVRVVFRVRGLLAYQSLVASHEILRSLALAIALAIVSIATAEVRGSLLSLMIGCASGVLVGLWAVWDARVEADGRHFVPSRWAGAALCALLAGRIAWRLASGAPTNSGWTLAEFMHNDSTLFLFGIFSVHYLVFSAGLLQAHLNPHLRYGRRAHSSSDDCA